jgi:hypothetical protein
MFLLIKEHPSVVNPVAIQQMRLRIAKTSISVDSATLMIAPNAKKSRNSSKLLLSASNATISIINSAMESLMSSAINAI